MRFVTTPIPPGAPTAVKPWQVVSLLLLLLPSLLLQGCSEEGEPKCPAKFSPIVDDFEPNSELLDLLAGCKNEWHPLTGNPCASDVPVIGAKKGFYHDTDMEWLKEAVHNEYTNCTVPNAGGGCRVWFTSTWGCEWDWYSMCFCDLFHMSPQNVPKYCVQWHCLQLMVEHRTCWEADWDSEWEQVCDLSGVWPLQLSDDDFEDMLQAQGVLSATNFSVSASNSLAIWNGGKPLFMFEGVCTTTKKVDKDFKPVVSPAGCTNANQWRRVQKHFLGCRCDKHSPTGNFCDETSCESRDNVGEKETQKTTCMEATADNKKCGLWEVQVQSYDMVLVGQCKTCVLSGCDSNVCSKYPLPRIVEFLKNDVDEYGNLGERIGFTMAHMCWILPIAFCPLAIFLFPVDRNSGDKMWVGPCMCGLPAILFSAFFIWLLAFLRHKQDDKAVPLARYSWQVPADPWWGIFFTLFISYYAALAAKFVAPLEDSKPNKAAFVVLIVGILVPPFAYTCGLLGVILSGPFFLVFGFGMIVLSKM